MWKVVDKTFSCLNLETDCRQNRSLQEELVESTINITSKSNEDHSEGELVIVPHAFDDNFSKDILAFQQV